MLVNIYLQRRDKKHREERSVENKKEGIMLITPGKNRKIPSWESVIYICVNIWQSAYIILSVISLGFLLRFSRATRVIKINYLIF